MQKGKASKASVKLDDNWIRRRTMSNYNLTQSNQ